MVLAENLKKAVLQYAVEGKLTEQLATDSNVDDLIEKIKKEKEELVKHKKARKEAPYPEISDDEKEFEIPNNWRWIRLGEIGVYKKGPFGSALTKSIFVPKSENAVKVYEQKNAIQKDASLGEYYITREYYDKKMSGFTVESGDIIVSCAGTIGETYIMPEKIELGIINQALMRMNISESINIDYFLVYFDHILKKNAKKSSNGSAIKNIPPFEVFKKMLIPLPPVEEQKRIVDKLNEIIKEIDEYSILEYKLAFLKENIAHDMKRSILQAAMQGKLSQQLASDKPVDELLDKVAIEKAELLKKKIAKKGKTYGLIKEDEIPFDIPDTWQWRRLADIVYSYGQKVPDKKFSYIDIGSIDNKNQKLNEIETVIEAKNAPSRARKIVRYGDVLYATVRPYLHNMCIIDKQFSEEPIASTGFAVMTCHTGIYNKFLLYYLLSPDFDRYANSNDNSKGMAYPAINDDKLYKALVPIPPIEEQQRIVDKLNQILPLCDDLKV